MSQKADKIADHHMSKPQHQRVASCVNKFVNPALFKTVEKMEVNIGRDQAGFLSLSIVSEPTFLPGESPSVRRDGLPWIIGILPAGQACRAGIKRNRGVAARGDRGGEARGH